jgi:epoxyqueuosine reductase
MESLDEFIKNQGWSFYGIADIKTIDTALRKHRIFFDEWIKKGYEADMRYLEKMEGDRYHPENKLPDIKSIIVLGAWYAGQDSGLRTQDSADKGVIAKYAVGKDYHNILKKKLIELSDYLKSNSNKHRTSNIECRTYISVDSGPTADRALAEIAGLGFFGKNTNIINPSHGSFFFIASVMMNLELEPTSKIRMPNCGNCRNCIKNCPTGALAGPGILDARKCISYLTIENKEGIPVELRPKIGNRLFGCDACQNCCPFNLRNSKFEIRNSTSIIPELTSDYGAGESLDIKDVLSIKSDEEFTEKFAGTPLMRAKRRGLIRNACVVAGNGCNRSLIPYLQKIAEKDDGMLKEHAEWGINRLKNN